MGIAYAKHLRDSGVEVIEREYQNMIHGFANFTIDPLAYNAVVEFADDLKNIV
jgi:acetyl esterase